MKYWSEGSFQQLQAAPPGKLYSKGQIPWRLLAYLLEASPEVDKVRNAIRKRLMDENRIQSSLKNLNGMLITLAKGGFVKLEPEPPQPKPNAPEDAEITFESQEEQAPYLPMLAHPTDELDKMLVFRSIHPIYGAYLLNHLGIANREERIQAFESVLSMPRPLLKYVRVPEEDQLIPGPLATERLNPELLKMGLISPPVEEEEEEEDRWKERPPTLAEKLRTYFDEQFPEVTDVMTQPVWAAGELLRFEGKFNLYVRSRDLVKQEGIIFRHLLRLILLLGEFAEVCPEETTEEEWQTDLREISEALTESCRSVDPTSTEKIIDQVQSGKEGAGSDEE